MSAPVVQTVATTTYGSRASTSIAAPAGIQNGDLLLSFMLTGASAGTPATPPAGFLPIPGIAWPNEGTSGGFTVRAYGWYKWALNESGVYVHTHITANTQGVMLRVSGADPTHTFEPDGTSANAVGTTSTWNGVTTTRPETLILLYGWDFGGTGNNLVVPAGSTPTFTEHVDIAPLVYVASGPMVTPGATGDKTHTNNSVVTDASGSVLIPIASLPPCLTNKPLKMIKRS